MLLVSTECARTGCLRGTTTSEIGFRFLLFVQLSEDPIATLSYLVSTYPAPAQPSFDRFGQYDRRHHVHQLLAFDDSQIRLLLLGMWVAIFSNSRHSRTAPTTPRGGCWAHLHRPADDTSANWQRGGPGRLGPLPGRPRPRA